MTTGNLRTLRLSTNGGRTFLSMISSDASSAGAGSTRRILNYYRQYNKDISQFYNIVFNLKYGIFADRAQYYIRNVL
jgi:hypothetical protein